MGFSDLWKRGLQLLGAFTLGARVGVVEAADLPAIEHGPFQIVLKAQKISSGRFPNVSGNPFERMPITLFQLKYRGQGITVQDYAEDQGKGVSFDEFWDAFIVAGAPRPAVIVARNGVYLLSESNGQLKMDYLAREGSDIATLQWIDGAGGKPGETAFVTLRASSQESHVLQGGRYLLVNGRTVLDTTTLKVHPVQRTSAAVEEMGGFNSHDWAPRWLSPGATQYVFVGSRTRVEDYAVVDEEFALIAVDFLRERVYAVPFDRDAIRYHIVEGVTETWYSKWFARHFAWTRDAAGNEILTLRKGVSPLPWEGQLVSAGDEGEYAGKINTYKLELAKASMLPVLVAFIERELGGKRLANAENQSATLMTVNGITLQLMHSTEFRRLILVPAFHVKQPVGPVFDLIESIGARFNAELAKGKHDQHFSKISGIH